MKVLTVITIFCCVLLSACEDENRVVIHTDKAPEAIGPYSQAILADHTLYLAGQIPIDPASGEMVSGGIEAQTHQVLKNIRAVLAAADCSFEDVVQVQIFLTDLNNYGRVNEIYATYFKNDPPARAVVEVKRLPKDSLIEIMVTATRH